MLESLYQYYKIIVLWALARVSGYLAADKTVEEEEEE
jgi:hypothetical protein